jgi:hypothetical protein
MGRKKSNSYGFFRNLDRSMTKWTAPISFVFILIVVVSIGVPTSVDIYQSWQGIDAKERAKVGIELIRLMATIIGGVAIFWNIILSRRQLATSQEQNITDRFSKAVEQLGHEKASVRIGGIYALARIAHDSSKDHWMIMEVLTAFVRDRRGLGGAGFSTQPKRFDKDVQSAASVIGRRNTSQDPDDAVLYMSYNDLRGVVFSETDYRYARFHGSDLREANFNRCKLQSTTFWKSNLGESRFRDADLSDADLVEADLRGADFQNCILQGADIQKANLEGVKGLTVEQVHSANNWQEAIYDANFLILLGSNDRNVDK